MTTNGAVQKFNRANVRLLTNDVLMEAYTKSHLWKYLVARGLIEQTDVERVKARRQHAVLRAELIKRGFEKANLDADPPIPSQLQMEIDQLESKKVMLTDDPDRNNGPHTMRYERGQRHNCGISTCPANDPTLKKVILTDG